MSSGRGRPVRYLVLLTTGWVGMRVFLLLPEAVEEGRLRLPRVVAAATATEVPQTPTVQRVTGRAMVVVRPARSVNRPLAKDAAVAPMQVELALVAPVEAADAEPGKGVRPLLPWPHLPPRPVPRRWSGSAWVAARGGAATGGPVQLGGGQAGIRLRRSIDAAGDVALVARAAAPLAGPGSEAALGIEWRPGGGAVAIVAERRFALDGGADGSGVGMIAGIDRTLSGAIRVEAYGQTGVVVRDGIEPYADGAVRVLQPVAAVGTATLRIGIGGWGAAQRGGARLDIGPSAVAVLPVAKQAVRLSLDWRQRVAGDAAPGSGIALTLGSDF